MDPSHEHIQEPSSADNRDALTFKHWSPGKGPSQSMYKTSVGAFACEIEDCDKTFSRKGDMERHSLSHESGPRAHDCLARRCRRKGTNGFWRLDKLKDHMDCKHPETEIERWYYARDSYRQGGGYRVLAKRGEHEEYMRSLGYLLYKNREGEALFYRVAETLLKPRPTSR